MMAQACAANFTVSSGVNDMLRSIHRPNVRLCFQPLLRPLRTSHFTVRAQAQTYNNANSRRKPELQVIMNDDIRVPEVRLMAEDKSMIGVVSTDEALRLAEEQLVDVIMVSPDANPPVCRLVEFSKYRYELEKASKEAKKKQREGRVETKELKFRPNTDVHDYQVRLRAAEKFIAKGNKVKLSLQFRGREMEFQDIGRQLFKRFIEDLGDGASVEAGPSMAGRQMSMTIAPVKK